MRLTSFASIESEPALPRHSRSLPENVRPPHFLGAITTDNRSKLLSLLGVALDQGRQITFDAVSLEGPASVCGRQGRVEVFETMAALSSLVHVARSTLATIYPDVRLGEAIDLDIGLGAKVVTVTPAHWLTKASRARA